MKILILNFLFLCTSSFIVAQDWVELSSPLYGDMNGTYGNAFGRAVSFNGEGDRIVVGDPSCSKNNQFDGRVTVFERMDTTWQQLGQEIYGKEFNAFLGGAVALNAQGDVFITTANSLKGEFNVYELMGEEWIQKGSTLPTLHANANNISVSINDSGDCVAVLGLDDGMPNIFSVLIYSWDALMNDWVQKGSKYALQE